MGIYSHQISPGLRRFLKNEFSSLPLSSMNESGDYRFSCDYIRQSRMPASIEIFIKASCLSVIIFETANLMVGYLNLKK